MSYWDRLSVDIQRTIFEMDPTFHATHRKIIQEITLLKTRHVMTHYCRVFFKNCALLPCEVRPSYFRIYSLSRQKVYVVTYRHVSATEMHLERIDSATGMADHQILFYQPEVGFGLLGHYEYKSPPPCKA